jgi:hypothetical protein
MGRSYMNLKTLNFVLCVMLVNILGNCALGSCSQNGDDITENSSSNNSQNIYNIPQKLPLTFGPETLDELKKDPNFIAVYGSIPAFENLEEREKWLDNLDEIMNEVNANFDQEMSKYFYPNGPITQCGYTIDGVIEVGVNKTVEEPFTDEVYQVFDSKASRMGIKEVPVVFVHKDLAVPAIIKLNVNETANLSSSGENNAEGINESSSNVNKSDENRSNKTNSSPGFGLLGGLACLFGVWRLKKK